MKIFYVIVSDSYTHRILWEGCFQGSSNTAVKGAIEKRCTRCGFHPIIVFLP